MLYAGSVASSILINGSTTACSEGSTACALTIQNSTFTNNTNSAIFMITDGFSFTAQHSTFTGNSAAVQGAALVIGSIVNANTNTSTPLQATITSSVFSSNTAGMQGGAVLIKQQASLRAYNCNFTDLTLYNNSAGQRGGAFYLQQVELQLSSSVFSQNSISGTDPMNSQGGAVYALASCAASANPQALYTTAPFACSFSITNTTFSNNSAGSNGGALDLKLDGYAVGVSQTSFTGNQITEPDGAGSAFDIVPLVVGGGLSRMVVFSECNFTENSLPGEYSSTGSIGTVTMQQVACIAFQSCIFDRNVASTGGGIFTTQVNSDESTCWSQALMLQTIPKPLLEAPALFDPLSPEPAPESAPEPEAEPFNPVVLDIRGSRFINNSAAGATGGAIALGSAINAAAIVNCTFDGNSSPDVGGAITIFSNALVTIDRTSFTANSAPSSKGVVYHFSQPLGVTSLAITDSNFTDNVGTAVSGDNSYMEINGSRFVNNSAGATGSGAIFIESLYRLLLNDCEFINNTSLDAGGAIHTASQDAAGVELQRITAYGNRLILLFVLTLSAVSVSLYVPACMPACLSVCPSVCLSACQVCLMEVM